jgi:hypothetical protein
MSVSGYVSGAAQDFAEVISIAAHMTGGDGIANGVYVGQQMFVANTTGGALNFRLHVNGAIANNSVGANGVAHYLWVGTTWRRVITA